MLTDTEFLALVNYNPEKALNVIINVYLRFVNTIIYNKLSDVCTAEDIEECVSDVFFEFYESAKKIDLNKGSVKAYLATIAKRRAIDLFRKQIKGVGKYVSMNDENYEEKIIGTASTDDIVIDKEEKEILISEIRSFGLPDSQIFIRRYYFGQSTKEISSILGLKNNTVDKKISRGLMKLSKILGGNINGKENY